jgi:hypothetical protein
MLLLFLLVELLLLLHVSEIKPINLQRTNLGDEVNGALDGDDIVIDGVHSLLYLIQKGRYAEIF